MYCILSFKPCIKFIKLSLSKVNIKNGYCLYFNIIEIYCVKNVNDIWIALLSFVNKYSYLLACKVTHARVYTCPCRHRICTLTTNLKTVLPASFIRAFNQEVMHKLSHIPELTFLVAKHWCPCTSPLTCREPAEGVHLRACAGALPCSLLALLKCCHQEEIPIERIPSVLTQRL